MQQTHCPDLDILCHLCPYSAYGKLYLSYFPPVETVEEVVGAPLIRVGLHGGLHARGPGDPDPLLLVVPPVTVKTLMFKTQTINFSWDPHKARKIYTS